MGEEIQAIELPPGAPVPKITPPEGVILTKRGLDGVTRKILYQTRLGSRGEVVPRSMIIREILPDPMDIPRTSMGIDRSHAGGRAKPLMSGSPVPVVAGGGLRLGQISPTSPTAPPVSSNPDAELQPPQAPPGTQPGACPGPIEMPDGRVINPDDAITLKDFCEMAPYFLETLKDMANGPRTGPVSLVGQPSGYAQVVSPAGGMFGQGGMNGAGGGMAGFPAGGGGGPGPAGKQGPPGPTAEIDVLTKVDGDFTAGPGAFVSVPGTQKTFSQGSAGYVVVFLQAVFGCGGASAQSNQIGIKVTDSDGNSTTYPLTAILAHTDVSDVNVFIAPGFSMWPVSLAAGSYTVEVVLRGLSAGEFCSAAGLGLPATLSANTEIPFAMAVFHR